jgi:hypothetical protein
MPRSERLRTQNPERFEKKLTEVRDRLLGDDISIEELSRMQLQIDLLERALSDELDFHHHDTNEHHDHVTIMEDPIQEAEARG